MVKFRLGKGNRFRAELRWLILLVAGVSACTRVPEDTGPREASPPAAAYHTNAGTESGGAERQPERQPNRSAQGERASGSYRSLTAESVGQAVQWYMEENPQHLESTLSLLRPILVEYEQAHPGTRAFAKSTGRVRLGPLWGDGRLLRSTSADRREMFVLGFLTGIGVSPTLEWPERDAVALSSCLEGMGADQLDATVQRYLADHPEVWHQPAGILVNEALVCRLCNLCSWQPEGEP